MKRLAIIGANESICMLIDKAKEMGYETHVFAWKCGDPGEAKADHFYPISIDKKDEILEKCREIGVEGVCSITSDYTMPTVNFVARKLGLPHNPEITDTVARNKFEMRKAFKEAGIYTPVFFRVTDSKDMDIKGKLSYPVIVKPVDRWSSKGVTRVDRPEDLEEALKSAIKESYDDSAIVEGFMDGPEYSAECICYRGERRILALTSKETTGFPHYIESGHFQPADISVDDKKKAESTILKALDALHIENGAAHAEFRILDNGEIGIIEIGARMGGDCIGTDLTPSSTGMDYIRMVIDVACGKEPDYSMVSEPSSVHIKYIINKNDHELYQGRVHDNPDSIIKTGEMDDNLSGEVTDSSTRHGYYIYIER